MTCEVCGSHTPSVEKNCDVWQQTAVSCKRSDYNKKIVQSVTSEQLCEETAQRVSPFFLPLFHDLRCG